MDTALKAECLALVPPKGRSSLFPLCEHQHYSYVIPSEVEGPPKCGTRHPSRRGPSTALRMTTLWRLSFVCESDHAKTHTRTAMAIEVNRRYLQKPPRAALARTS